VEAREEVTPDTHACHTARPLSSRRRQVPRPRPEGLGGGSGKEGSPRRCRNVDKGSKVTMNDGRDDRAREERARLGSGFQTLLGATSSFRQAAAALGSSADCDFLRRELERTGTFASDVAGGLSGCLTSLLSDGDPKEERREAERVWVHFLSAAESFLSDLRKAADLMGRFPLGPPKDRRSLVNTGCTEDVADGEVGASRSAAAADEGAGLRRHLDGLEDVLSDMQIRVPVAFWSVESTQPPWAEVQSQESAGDPEESSTTARCSAFGCVRF
ncbi:regulator of G-protein signaling 9-binding protein, partial [Syngnathoides biaculeatus]|uniref:regulator of G-protein signaling 9-binding protein n=1 Tax=Syngnathoides biaculeatus TaxID=300417 RepID=UPI002ADE90DF